MMSREAREDAERYIRERATEYFKHDRSGKGYICPICGSGDGAHGTGITENPKDKGHFTCWAGCFQSADIFEIIGRQYGLTDFNEILNKACEIFGVTLSNGTSYSYSRPSPKPKDDRIPAQDNEVKDFTEFYEKAAANLSQTNYYRGISLETLKRFDVGFMPSWRANEKAPASPRLIIPIWQGGYLARDTRPELTEQQAKYSKMRVGKTRLFNPDALKQNLKPVFVVEGEIDALSIIDAGGEAVALCSVANIGKLIEAVKERANEMPPLIIQLDNDVVGQTAENRLVDALIEMKFFLYRHVALPEIYKDANEFLMNDREGFEIWVKAEEKADFVASKEENQSEAEAIEEAGRLKFESETVANRLNNFLRTLQESREGRAIPTGFERLDEILDGGLYPGLYSVGAISSLGKTTLCLQIADNIAQAGYGVLIFSLEMSANELMAKSLSRLTLIKGMAKNGTKENAKTTRGILRGDYNEAEKVLFSEAIRDYRAWGRCINITEGIGDVGIEEIKVKVEEYKKYNGGQPPVVIIDYLQIIEAYSEKKTDKQNVDKNITELKRMSRDYQIPIIGISSFNRENYSAPVSMTSFKESGAIEYSSDVLIGLQYKGWDYVKGEDEKKRKQRLDDLREQIDRAIKEGGAVEIELKVLKHRNGRRGKLPLEFFPQFNYFRSKGDYQA